LSRFPLSTYLPHRDLLSFPTRRSSDLASKSGGFCNQAWMCLPSKVSYQISSGSVRFSLENSSSFMCVSCLDDAADVVRSRTKRSDRKSTRLNSSHEWISYAVFCLKKKK